jgi:cytochrome c oxidase accessory protein FixG
MIAMGSPIDGEPGPLEHDEVFDSHEAFRNELASVHADGRRKWVYARQPSGPRYRLRTVVSSFLLAFLFGAPLVKVHGQPLLLLNVLERRFVFFGIVFWPQDFYLVVLIALTALVTVVLSSASIGRVWCGWLCPQTVFMEMLFRKLEYLIDGSAAQQLRRDKAPLTWDTVWRRVLKHAIFLGLSFAIANVFLAYVIGADALRAIVTAPPSQHLTGLVAITLFSVVFYGVFARFREQACTLACPYGRLMSALTDTHTVTVTYDWKRGEPRARLLRTASPGRSPVGSSASSGDCIDCGQCVTVCPTGIDIRNGIQLECINCTACMDACDDVMRRVERPSGLIRLTSENAVRTGHSARLTTRVGAYALVWLLLAGATTAFLVLRRDIDVLILRQPGTLYVAFDGESVANFYNVQVINRTRSARSLEYGVVSPTGATVTPLGPIQRVGPYGLVESRLLVRLPTQSLVGPATPVRFEVRSDGTVVSQVNSSFLGPAAGGTGR